MGVFFKDEQIFVFLRGEQIVAALDLLRVLDLLLVFLIYFAVHNS